MLLVLASEECLHLFQRCLSARYSLTTNRFSLIYKGKSFVDKVTIKINSFVIGNTFWTDITFDQKT